MKKLLLFLSILSSFYAQGMSLLTPFVAKKVSESQVGAPHKTAQPMLVQ